MHADRLLIDLGSFYYLISKTAFILRSIQVEERLRSALRHVEVDESGYPDLRDKHKESGGEATYARRDKEGVGD